MQPDNEADVESRPPDDINSANTNPANTNPANTNRANTRPALTASEPEPIQQSNDPTSAQLVTLSELPKVTLGDAPSPVHADERIEELIASLASIESPDFGLSATMSGQAFLPIEGMNTADTFVITDHRIESSAALKELVKIGPLALPALLQHLDDDTHTRLKIDRSTGLFGGMWFANKLWGNPANEQEQAVFQAQPQEEVDPLGRDHVDSYTVKVGDICFVAIGQIVGRRYQAVRYQPTACVVLSSPTHDATLAAQVRAIWQSDNPRQKLLDSLLLDFATRSKSDGKSLDGMAIGSYLQCEAAMRLLYYFPTETAPLIADRITQLNVGRMKSASGRKIDAFVQREAENQVSTQQFLAAVTWSQHPAIRAAIEQVTLRTDDVDLLRSLGKDRSERERN